MTPKERVKLMWKTWTAPVSPTGRVTINKTELDVQLENMVERAETEERERCLIALVDVAIKFDKSKKDQELAVIIQAIKEVEKRQ